MQSRYIGQVAALLFHNFSEALSDQKVIEFLSKRMCGKNLVSFYLKNKVVINNKYLEFKKCEIT